MPIAGLFTGLVLVIFAVGLYVNFLFYGPGPKTIDGNPIEVQLSQGQGASVLANRLEASKAIHSAMAFKILSKLSGTEKSFQAGVYAVPSGASLIDVFEMIKQGKVMQLKITIAEGRTAQQVVRILMNVIDLKGNIDVPPEGSVLPETYIYERGEQRQAVLDRMLKAGRDTLDELWLNRAPGLPLKKKPVLTMSATVLQLFL
jgi:UPF0755 protein